MLTIHSSLLYMLCYIVFYSKSIDDRVVFDDIEFFVPQLAHMSIHLKEKDVVVALERLTAAICLTSAHLALQLGFIYTAALEDFQPELANGQKNPQCDAALYARCAHLLQFVERTFVYGGSHYSSSTDTPAVSPVSPDLKSKPVASGENVDLIMQASENMLQGELLYKRVERKHMYSTKPWKTRYFRICDRILYCFRDAEYTELLRSIPLQDCEVHGTTSSTVTAGPISSDSAVVTIPAPKEEEVVVTHTSDLSGKYDYYFEVSNKNMSEQTVKFLLRADSLESYNKWMNALLW